MIDDLIYDVGMNNGVDTAYYLQRGYRVLAIEANPDLCAQAEIRFKDAIDQRRVTIVNAAISDRSGLAEFWVSGVNSEWSSLDRSRGALQNSPQQRISVRCETFDSILQKFGVPFFLKIDIEGSDRFCLEALKGQPELPRYLSTELHEAYDSIAVLAQLGFARFKLISQIHFEAIAPERSRYERWYPVLHRLKKFSGAINRLTRRRSVGNALFKSQHQADWTFTLGSSGPFGENTAGRWLTANEARRTYDRCVRLKQQGQLSPYWHSRSDLFWVDVHARRE